MKSLNQKNLQKLLNAVYDSSPVNGSTHSFYRYPARFSPLFARAVIEVFTKPGDVVYDPFMGGGTTLVEALALGRRVIGTDINSLAVFITKVKTTAISESDTRVMRSWFENVEDGLNLREPQKRSTQWIEHGYQRNIGGRTTWPICKTLELALANINSLPKARQQDFIRCVLLRTAQWALDCRKEVPSAKVFREQCIKFFEEMVRGAVELRHLIKNGSEASSGIDSIKPLCLQRSVVGIESVAAAKSHFPPQLILTSPPYPGVHVLYHRWQVNGRKETPAPYWIAGSLDGNGASFYTFGGRSQEHLKTYFEHAHSAFSSLAKIADKRTFLVQLVAFSDPSWQLPAYLAALEKSGFREIPFPTKASDGRLWRQVPNRKFYAGQLGSITASREVLLVHQLR